jgi:hypothetical protein
MNWPKPPLITTPGGSWLDRLLKACISRQLLPGPGYRLKQTASGTILELDRLAGGGTTAAPLVIQMFALTTLPGGDVVKGKTWNGSALGGSEVTIAKPHRLRKSIASEKIDSITITYATPGGTADVDNNRTASDGTTPEAQVVYPRYTTLTRLGEATPGTNSLALIVAAKPANGTGIAGVDWIEVLPARVWARRFTQ